MASVALRSSLRQRFAGRRRRSGPLTALAAVALATLVACGSAPSSVVLTLDASSANLLRGSQVQVHVTAVRSGGAGSPVALSVVGLPTGVTATFAPPSLSGGSLTSTLTLTASQAATAGDYALNVIGSGGGLSATAAISVNVTSLTVTGRVVGPFEKPMSGAVVGAQGINVITDSSGGFTLAGLAVPYDLSAWSNTGSWVHVFEGLTSDEQVLTIATQVVGFDSYSATIFGTLTGGVTPVGASQKVVVCVEGIDGTAYGCTQVAPGENSYSLKAQWFGSVARQVRVHALEVQTSATGYPVSFPGYSSTPLTISNGGIQSANLNLGTALASTTVQVDVEAEASLMGALAGIRLGPNLTLPITIFEEDATSFDVIMPVIAGGSYAFTSIATMSQLGWHAEVTGPQATISIPEALEPLAPAANTTGITKLTDFSVTSPGGGPITYLWLFADDMVVGLTTMSASHAIPDLTPYGMSLPPTTQGAWLALAQPGSSSDDGAGSLGDYYRFLAQYTSIGSRGHSGSGSLAVTSSREFTTAP